MYYAVNLVVVEANAVKPLKNNLVETHGRPKNLKAKGGNN